MLELTESAVASGAGRGRCAIARRCATSACAWPSTISAPGTSSLAELRNLPVDVLKLAKPFVDALEARPGEREFVRVIVELGRVLGLTVAAEGVETDGQLALLRELGVDVAQGNLMAAGRGCRGDRAPPAASAGERGCLTSVEAPRLRSACTRARSRPRAASGGRPWR